MAAARRYTYVLALAPGEPGYRVHEVPAGLKVEADDHVEAVAFVETYRLVATVRIREAIGP
jgi:hypothetical protein